MYLEYDKNIFPQAPLGVAEGLTDDSSLFFWGLKGVTTTTYMLKSRGPSTVNLTWNYQMLFGYFVTDHHLCDVAAHSNAIMQCLL